jgi:hypothetical protein
MPRMFAIPSRSKVMKSVLKSSAATSAVLWARLPLAAFAGLRVTRLDSSGAEVTLPAGWKTQNPFRSTYFAAQAMAAEMSTGAPALLFIEESGERISSLVTGLHARFTKKATRRVTFTFSDGDAMRAAVDRAAHGTEGVGYTARSVGKMADGTVVAEFDIEWSFKRK